MPDIPSGPNGRHAPFRLLECDVTGGVLEDIAPGDSALAFYQYAHILSIACSKPKGVFSSITKISSSPPPFSRCLRGQNPVTGTDPFPNEFHPRMATDALFPEFSSEFYHADGVTYDVPCFIPGEKEIVLDAVECTAGFLPPMEEGYTRNCVSFLSFCSVCAHPPSSFPLLLTTVHTTCPYVSYR